MAKQNNDGRIRLRGVRHNNLKGFDLDLPLGKLIVITGLSGSGKSSLAFDTLYAEGQRRYIETFSPYARQFFDRMDKPRVDKIEGIPPAIAIEQRNSVRTTRSTVGTMTEICDYLKVLWPHLSRLYCRGCGAEVRKDSPRRIWEELGRPDSGPGVARQREVLITFDLPLSEKLSWNESLQLIGKQGYQRLLLSGEVVRLEEAGTGRGLPPRAPGSGESTRPAAKMDGGTGLTVIQDRLPLAPKNRARFIEACEQAYHFGKGRLAVRPLGDAGAPDITPRLFSLRFHCAACDLEYREPTPALFSFNHPLGACPACKGFGRIITIDYDLAVPDRRLSLKQGAVKPWRTGFSADCQRDLLKFCRATGVPVDRPFHELSAEQQRWVVEGDADYGIDEEHHWPRAWYGVKGYFRWLESKAYKMHVRVLLSRYRAYAVCPDCRGKRLQPEALQFRLPDESRRSLADFYELPVHESLQVAERLANTSRGTKPNDPVQLALGEVRSRLAFLNQVGLGYLTLNRPMRGLSGGETERVSLTSCLGTRLVNTLYVLDEPSVGLHPRDTAQLVGVLRELRDLGNTVVVVEHEAEVMRAADQLVDLGPGHGESGGEVVFQGPLSGLRRSRRSLTGAYLSGRERIEIPRRRPVAGCPVLRLTGASRHNLKDLAVGIPLGRFVCLTGVSGSGKTTLVRECLLPALQEKLCGGSEVVKASDRMEAETQEDAGEGDDSPRPLAPGALSLEGWEAITRVVLVDQSQLGKTPRSNPAVYIGAFEDIREVFAQSDEARERGLNASAFSFNSRQGQCERCRGAGFEKIEMQFLSDVFIRCPDCDGRRYREHILEVRLASRATTGAPLKWSIGDLLEGTVDEVLQFLGGLDGSRAAGRATAKLELLREVGLGYLRLGQPINTLSGGECQRLKLVSHLAGAAVARAAGPRPADGAIHPGTLFLFDEPTTGLHFDDVRVLVDVFQRLVDAGQSVLVIEHNLELLKCADWIIDLGPEAGEGGGRIVAAGTPEEVAAVSASHTGRFLRGVLE